MKPDKIEFLPAWEEMRYMRWGDGNALIYKKFQELIAAVNNLIINTPDDEEQDGTRS